MWVMKKRVSILGMAQGEEGKLRTTESFGEKARMPHQSAIWRFYKEHRLIYSAYLCRINKNKDIIKRKIGERKGLYDAGVIRCPVSAST